MTLFASPAPHLYAIPTGADFASVFAAGFWERLASLPPETAARTVVMVNTRRSLRRIEEAIAAHPGRAAFVPRMVILPELGTDPLTAPELGPPIGTLERRLHLTRLVERYLSSHARDATRTAPLSAAPALADSLARLMDEFQDEDVAPERMDSLFENTDVSGGVAEHWQRTLGFVDIVRNHWPAILAEASSGAVDPRARQRAAIRALIGRWARTPPTAPVIAAASTGSVGSTAELLAAIARLANGAVVLPGFDTGIEPAIWDAAGAEHPMGPFKGLMGRLGTTPADVVDWGTAPDDEKRHQRRALWAQVLRPAPVTDHWHRAAEELHDRLPTATAGLSLVEAEHPAVEATAIALAIRDALEKPDHTVALITPDAALARRVTAELDAFGVVPDDSLGRPLALTPPGILMSLIVEAVERSDAVRLASMLQHPLLAPGCTRAEHLTHARAYEREVLRAKPGGAHADLVPAWPMAEASAAAWHARVSSALMTLGDALRTGDLPATVAAHVNAAEALTCGPAKDDDHPEPPAIWTREAGAHLRTFMSEFGAAASAHGTALQTPYRSLLSALMQGEQVRPRPEAPHPRVSIWGTREARVQSGDTVILAGLNESVWPGTPDPDPWLSRPMRDRLGLPPPERTVGLAAHDFLQAACHPNVILTRSRRIDGTPTVPSRWLVRLRNFLGGVGAGAALKLADERGMRLIGLTRHLRRPESSTPRATRPRPTPPVALRPRGLPVTSLETLVRDAYAVYARRILGLRVLEPLGRAPDARERGTLIHTILEAFIERTRTAWPDQDTAHALLLETTDDVLSHTVHEAELRRIWRARVVRFASWFIAAEDARRRNAMPIALEVDGALMLPLGGGPFEITAKADRIDRLRDGTAAIYDYKTGQPPTAGMIAAGFSHQLHVQGAILRAGGFGELGPLDVQAGAYIGLTGAGTGGKSTDVELHAAEIDTHMQRVTQLLAAFDREATAYVSRGRVERDAFAGDYDHLARRGEWEDAE